MIFDTDVVIWGLRGNVEAGNLIRLEAQPMVSVATRMELFYGVRNKHEAAILRKSLLEFQTVPLSSEIGIRADLLIQAHGLSTNIDPLDAIIAATALEAGEILCTANQKDFRAIAGLELRIFKP